MAVTKEKHQLNEHLFKLRYKSSVFKSLSCICSEFNSIKNALTKADSYVHSLTHTNDKFRSYMVRYHLDKTMSSVVSFLMMVF